MGVDAVSRTDPQTAGMSRRPDHSHRRQAIANIYDYMASTRNKNAGDAVEVVVLHQ